MASPALSSLLDQPLLPPPRGEESNFAHPESRASEIYIAAGICLPLITFFAALRLYAKVAIMKRKTWDDVSCALGLLAGVSYISVTVAAVSGGAYGKHEWDITLEDFTKETLVLSLLVEAIYGPSIWFIKLSLFVIYFEVFGVHRWLRYCATVGIVVTGLFYLASMITFLVMCAPTNGRSQFAYISALASPRCTRSRPLLIVLGVINVISDLYWIILPLPAIWYLQLPFRRKVGVSVMFLTGSVACVASILGLSYRVDQNRSKDDTWAMIPAWVTTCIEMTAGTLVCCMPTTTAVFKSLQTSISSFLATYGRGLQTSVNSTTRNRHERLNSTSNLQSNDQDSVQERQSNHENSWSEWQLEHEAGSTFPLKDTKIRKTTEIDVTRKP